MIFGVFFVVRFPDGVVRFMYDDIAFEVCGISDAPENLMPSLPCAVLAKLVPFDGLIVFAESMVMLPIDVEEEDDLALRERAREIYKAGAIVSSAEVFELVSRVLEVQRMEDRIKELDEEIAELDREIEARGGSGKKYKKCCGR